MRILYLSTSGSTGGAETSLLCLLEGLRELHSEWQLDLVAGGGGQLVSRASELGVGVEVLTLPAELSRLGDGARLRTAWAAVLATLRYRSRLRRLILRIRPDIIHTIGFKMHVLLASLSQGTYSGRRVCHMHDYVSGRRWAGALMRVCMPRFDAVVANSESVALDVMTISGARGKVTSIYNGLPSSRLGREGRTLDLDLLAGLPCAPEGVLRIGLPATFGKWKGHFTFLRAIALLPESLNVRAYIIGGPIYQTEGSQYTLDEMRAEAVRLRVAGRVGFTGCLDDVPAALRALDIVVHASTSPEPFGMVIIEAQACGKPVIVSGAGGAAEIVEDGETGLTHTPGDAASLARQIERLARDPGLRTRLGTNGYISATSRFQASDMAKRFAELYNTKLHNKVAPGATRKPPVQQVGKRCFVSD
jgi:glycosyltransferase involved in cell wall biosynthesis